MQPYSMQQLDPVQETIRDGLVMGARYSVVLSVNTSGGMSTSSRMFFAGKSSMSHDRYHLQVESLVSTTHCPNDVVTVQHKSPIIIF